MLTPAFRSTTRRGFLWVALLAAAAGACARVPQRAASVPTPTAGTSELDAWNAAAQAMLSDALRTLRTFDVFAAFRVGATPDSGMRLASELAWDPPTGAAWDDATHLARSLHGRAEQLLQAVITAEIDPSSWREQRAIAEGAHELIDLGDAIAAYRNRIDGLGPGDASGALSLLDQAWLRWETTAARFALSRSEAITCAG